jgi:hypothetical protein
MIFSAYEGQQKDLQWVTVTLTVISTVLLIWRITNTITSRGWLGLEDVFVIMANVSTTPPRNCKCLYLTIVDLARSTGGVYLPVDNLWIRHALSRYRKGWRECYGSTQG